MSMIDHRGIERMADRLSAEAEVRGRSPWADALRRFARNRAAVAGLVVLVLVLLFGLFGQLLALDAVGVPDYRLFLRGDETELHRRLVRSGLAFGTCLQAAYLHPEGTEEFQPILAGRLSAQYPADATKRFFTYRNRGYVQSQRGQRRLIPQEWVRFGWYFLVTRRDPAGLRVWWRLRRLGRQERFARFENLGERSDGGKAGEGRDGRGNR